MVQPPKDLKSFASFLEIVKALRGPEGCPWDKEQTHRTLTPFAIEEAHELAEAIEQGDQTEVIGELGDLLLQVVLHAEIARQESRFDINDVIFAIAEKMVRRHPHVFGDTKVADSSEVLANWSEIKAQEKALKQKVDSPATSTHSPDAPTRFDISVNLPALMRSHKIGEKTRRLRFDWQTPQQVFAKIEEELAELKAEMPQSDSVVDLKKLEHEVGDVLFSVSQLARHLGLDGEQCLRTANARFEKRFFTMRTKISESGRAYDDLSAEELEQAWQETKAYLEKK